MTARTPALSVGRRAAAIVASLVAACAMAMAVGVAGANAAVVGNPGNFTATWNGGSFQYGNQTFTPSGSFNLNVAADGTMTASGMSFPGQSAPNVVNGNVQLQQVTLTPQVTGNWTGHIDPRPGVGTMSLSGGMQIHLYSNRSGYIGIATNTSTTTCVGSTATTVSPSGNNYDWTSGTVSLNYGPFTGGGASGCNARSNIIGGSTSSQDGPVNNEYQMNGSGNTINAGLTISPAILPPNIVPDLKVSPAVAATDQTVNLNAGDSFILPISGVAQCDSPSPAEPDCGYRWDFDNDGTVDEVTNGPTTSHVFGPDGVYNPKVTIFDTSGLSYDATATVTTQSRPEAQIDSNPPAVTKETVNEFTFSIPANPYSATTECSVDGSAWSACTSGEDFTFTQADDTIGAHNFRVRAVTPEGVTGPADEYDFTIDRVKPRVTVNTHPVNPTNATSASFTFIADKPNTTLECQMDGGSWVPCGTNSSGSRSYNGLSESSPNPIEAPNPHKFRVRATDQYGNVGGDGNPGGGGYDWDIDLTGPIPTFTTKPANPSNDVDPVFVWENNESIQLAQCRLATNGNQGPWQNCGSLTTKSFEDLADATYSFGIRTLDIAGNWSTVVTHHWLLETVTPPLVITSTPKRYSNRTSAQFLFNAEEGSTTKCQLDSEPVQDPCESGVKYSYLSAGTHIFSVTATDAALNETTRSYTWDVKTAKPAVAIQQATAPDAASTTADAAFDLVTANGDAECRLDGGAWTACDSNEAQSYTGLTDGNHTFEVRAVDEYDNVSPIDGYSWLVVANAPVVSLGSTPDANTNKSTGIFRFTVDSADDNATTACTLDGMPAFDCGSPAAVAGLADGDHTFEVAATDSAGQIGVAPYEWSVKAKIPGLGFDATPAGIANTSTATFEFSSDEDDLAYECRLDGSGFAPCESPVELNGLGQGGHNFTVRATDSVGNRATEAYVWTVDTAAPTVSFDQVPAAETVRVSEVIKFHSSEPATLACKLDGGSWAACTSPTLLKGLAVGQHTFAVKATDVAGNEGPEVSTSWKVDAPTEPEPAQPLNAPLPQAAPRAMSAPAGQGEAKPKAKTKKAADVRRAKAKRKAQIKRAKAQRRAKARARAKVRAKKKRAQALKAAQRRSNR